MVFGWLDVLLTGWLFGQFVLGFLVDWLVGCLAVLLPVGPFVVLLIGSLVGWLVGGFVGWRVRWLALH